MSFFSKADANGIVEDHIIELFDLEQSEMKKLLRRYKEVRQELRDRLSVTRGDTFTSQQLRGALVQVEAALEAQGRALKTGISESSKVVTSKSIEHLLDEINTFDSEFTGAVSPINLNAALITNDVDNLLVSQYESSIDAYTAAQRSAISSELTRSAISHDSLGEVMNRLSTYMLGEEWRLQRLARTELHNAYGMGKLRGLTQTRDRFIPDLKKALFHPMDARTGADSKYLSRINPIVNIDEPFKYTWDGKKRVFMSPPDRPNDRAIIVPYREAWGSASDDSGVALH